MDQTRGWAAQLAADVGRRVAERRATCELTAQQLANRCAALGMPSLSRIVVTKLENGRREAVSLAELLVLAQALETTPVLLTFPLGRQQEMEVLPGKTLSTWDSALWLSGEVRLSETPEGLDVIWADDDDVVPLYHRHDQLVADYRDIGPGEGVIRPDGTVIHTGRDFQLEVIRDLRSHRSRMRKLGLVLPELPPELAHIDDQQRQPTKPTTTEEPVTEPVSTPEPQPVATAIVTSRLGVLVGRRQDGKPPWTFIAGEVEPGETAPFAAVREVKEETGLEVEPGEVIGERVHPKTGRTMIYVAARPVRSEDLAVFVGDERELAEVKWVSLAEADELMKAYGMFGPVREYLARELGG